MAGQKQNEMVYAQNLIISWNDGERETTTLTMVDDRQWLQLMEMINQQSTKKINHRISHTVWWCWSHFRAPDLSRGIDAFVSHRTKMENWSLWRQSKQSIPTWADNDRQQQQTGQSNQQPMSFWCYLRSFETRIRKFHCCSCSTRWDIVQESFACHHYTTNKTDGMQLSCFDSTASTDCCSPFQVGASSLRRTSVSTWLTHAQYT